MTWKMRKLGDVLELRYGKSLPARKRTSGEVPVYGSGGIDGHNELALIKGPGVIVGRKGSVGSVFYEARDFFPIDTVYYVWPKHDAIDLRFAYYLLKNLPLASLNTDAAVPGLNRERALSIAVRLPDQRGQETILSILSAYDDLIQNNRRRITLLEGAARILYREWFVRLRFPGHDHVKIVDGLPEGWGRGTFADFCETIGGGTPQTEKPEYWNDGDIAWYTPTDITRNSCLALLDSATKITEAGLRSSSAKMLPSGTLLMTSRASVGFFGIIETPSCTNQGFISVIPHEPNARMYLLHNLMHRVEEIRSHAGGATYKEISKGKFRALPVVLPKVSLLREFEGQTTTIHAQVRALHSMNQKLAQARDLLLPRLLNGEIGV